MKPITNITYPAFALFAFACFALSPQARATCQDGCLTNDNTVLGDSALFDNIGSDNTAVGYIALEDNTAGINNTAVGSQALSLNTTGSFNTATGSGALYHNNADNNTASGAGALADNIIGVSNTAVGYIALTSNTTGNDNTANGAFALDSNTTGNENIATGSIALSSNTTGSYNTAIGSQALSLNSGGDDNIAVGHFAGTHLTTGSHNIDIGNFGFRGEANTIRIGRVGAQTATFMAGISGATVPTGVAVIVDSSGHLGTTTSSARFKDEIKPMDRTSEAILALQPVMFRYKKELDPDGVPQFGLVAEDVEKVNPDLVARDEQGKPYTVRYEAVNAMLLNEFLKEHRKVEQLTRDFESKLAKQQKQIQQLTAGLQKVSAQLELSKPAPQTVLNN